MENLGTGLSCTLHVEHGSDTLPTAGNGGMETLGLESKPVHEGRRKDATRKMRLLAIK